MGIDRHVLGGGCPSALPSLLAWSSSCFSELGSLRDSRGGYCAEAREASGQFVESGPPVLTFPDSEDPLSGIFLGSREVEEQARRPLCFLAGAHQECGLLVAPALVCLWSFHFGLQAWVLR